MTFDLGFGVESVAKRLGKVDLEFPYGKRRQIFRGFAAGIIQRLFSRPTSGRADGAVLFRQYFIFRIGPRFYSLKLSVKSAILNLHGEGRGGSAGAVHFATRVTTKLASS